MTTIYMKYSRVTVNGKQLGSKKTRSAASSNVFALWNVNWFGPCPHVDSLGIATRFASINYFCKHSVDVRGENVCTIQNIGKPITVWHCDIFGIHTIVPVQLIKCRCVSLVDTLENSDVTIVVPTFDNRKAGYCACATRAGAKFTNARETVNCRCKVHWTQFTSPTTACCWTSILL